MPNEPSPAQSDLDALMSEDPLNLSDQDIDRIILYQRNARANREAGIKPKRQAKTGGMKISLEALGLKQKPKPVVPGQGLRRL